MKIMEEVMETLMSIYKRRSIRKFKKDQLPKEDIEKILEAGIQAPSGKNLQPWSFVVLQGDKKDEMISIIDKTLNRYKELNIDTGSAKMSTVSMDRSSVIILIFNTGIKKDSDSDSSSSYKRLVDIQSIGGLIQTMLLTAQDMGIGSLWICDIYYSNKEICDYVNTSEELIAAVALGYADESPKPRPRKNMIDISQWLG